jgi:hypothetical protein
MGFLDLTCIPGDTLFVIPDATLYHFGVLTSVVHMAWMRAFCGRLEMRYSYSNTIVYNTFPWPDVTDEQKATIEKLAQAILDARAADSKSSLANQYDRNAMTPALSKAHQNLDRAIKKLYGFSNDITEPEMVAELMKRYQKLVNEDKSKSKKQKG